MGKFLTRFLLIIAGVLLLLYIKEHDVDSPLFWVFVMMNVCTMALNWVSISNEKEDRK